MANKIEVKDFMFYKSFYDSMKRCETLYGEDIANRFCLEIMRFGVTGETQYKFPTAVEACFCGIKPLILKSKEKYVRVIKERKKEERRNKYAKSINR